MIYSDSRYANGFIHKAYDSRSGFAQITVSRVFPSATQSYYIYTWKEDDRIDVIAQRVYGSTGYWHKIMDYNPEIANADDILPGTPIRLPNV